MNIDYFVRNQNLSIFRHISSGNYGVVFIRRVQRFHCNKAVLIVREKKETFSSFLCYPGASTQKRDNEGQAGEPVSSNRYFQTTAAITPPMTGAIRNSQSCASAVPPRNHRGSKAPCGIHWSTSDGDTYLMDHGKREPNRYPRKTGRSFAACCTKNDQNENKSHNNFSDKCWSQGIPPKVTSPITICSQVTRCDFIPVTTGHDCEEKRWGEDRDRWRIPLRRRIGQKPGQYPDNRYFFLQQLRFLFQWRPGQRFPTAQPGTSSCHLYKLTNVLLIVPMRYLQCLY